MPRSLAVAIVLWKRGDLVPVDILTDLIAEGYDIGALEARFAI